MGIDLCRWKHLISGQFLSNRVLFLINPHHSCRQIYAKYFIAINCVTSFFIGYQILRIILNVFTFHLGNVTRNRWTHTTKARDEIRNGTIETLHCIAMVWVFITSNCALCSIRFPTIGRTYIGGCWCDQIVCLMAMAFSGHKYNGVLPGNIYDYLQ